MKRRDALQHISSERVLRECEALLITVLGSGDQNSMRFQTALRWNQLTETDTLPGGIARKVEPSGFTDWKIRSQIQD